MKNSKKYYMKYIADSFDCESMEIAENAAPKEKAKKFLKLIKDRHSKNDLKNVTEHLQGLGEYISIDYMNFDIIERAKKYGVINKMLNNAKFSKYHNKDLALERIEEQITNNYWRIMASYILQMAK